MKKPKKFTAKQRKYLESLNTQKRTHICLTLKQLQAVLLSLSSTATYRARETERAYYRKIIRQIKEQVAC